MMGSDQYCLKWNNHWANLVRVFNSLLHSETFVDVTLACEGRHLKAHRLVLSACSPYFKELLVSHPDRHPIVILKDVRFEELQNLIQFIYNGEVSVEQQALPSLLGTAKELQIRGLADNPAFKHKNHTSTNSKPNDQPTNNISVSDTDEEVPKKPRKTSSSREGSPISKRRKVDDLSPQASLTDIPSEVVASKGIAGPSREKDEENILEDLAEEKENVEPQVDITKQPKDKPPDASRLGNESDNEYAEIIKDVAAPEVILEEDDTVITTNGTCSPLGRPPSSVSSPLEVPPISSTTPNPQISFLQQAFAMGFQQPLHFLQNPLDHKGSQQPMSPTGLAQAKNILNFVDLLKSVGTNLPPGVIQPNLVNNSGNVTPGMQSPCQNSSLSNGSNQRERNPLTCHICARIMPSSQVLEEHIRIHEEEKPYKCDQCGQRYKYQSAFQRHQEQNHTAKLPGDKPYRCEVCGQCFKYHKSFTKHRANHDLLDNFLKTEPSDDSKGTTAIRALQESYLQRLLHPSNFPSPEGGLVIKEETKEEVDDGSLKDAKSPCLVSSTSVPTMLLENGEIKEEDEEIDIDEIVPDVPGDGEEEDEEEEDLGKFFYCTHCKLTFRDAKAFDGHCRLSPQCSKDTLKEVSVGGDISVTSIPSSAESPPITSSPQPSSQGGTPQTSGSVVFSSPPGMLYTLVSGMPPTSTFPAAAPTILDLSKFVNIHHNGLPNILPRETRPTDNFASYNLGGCTAIAPGGTTVGNLLSGLEDERPFKCMYCQKGFKGRENLKLHIRTHTGEKPYNCGVCGKAFGGRSDMNRHLRIHTGEKPYPCKVCGKKFARADYLSKHITTHLGIPFAKPVHSLQQSLQNLETMQNLQNLENIHNSVTSQSLLNALPSLQSLQLQQSVPAFQSLQSFQNLQTLQNLQTSVPNLQSIAPNPPVIHNSKEEIPNLSK